MPVTIDPRTGAPVIVSGGGGPALSMQPPGGGGPPVLGIDEGPPNFDPGKPPSGWSRMLGGDGGVYWVNSFTGQWYNPDNGMLQSAQDPKQWAFSPLPGHTPLHPASGGPANAGPSGAAPGAGGPSDVPVKIVPGPDGKPIGVLIQVSPGTTIPDGMGGTYTTKEPTWIYRAGTDAGNSDASMINAAANAQQVANQANQAAGTLQLQKDQLAAQITQYGLQNDLAKAQLLFERGKALGLVDGQETLESVIQRGQLVIQGKLADNTIAGTMGFDVSGRPTLARSEAFGFDEKGNPTFNVQNATGRFANGQTSLARDLGEAESHRADVTLNMGRQNQAFTQGNAMRDQYRQDVNSGLARQGQSFNQQQALRQEAMTLARSPRDYASYMFMKGGLQAPAGVGLFDVLSKAGKQVVDPDTYLGGHGLGSVRATGIPDVPQLEDFLYAQDQYSKGKAPPPVAAPSGPPLALTGAGGGGETTIQAELEKRRAARAA